MSRSRGISGAFSPDEVRDRAGLCWRIVIAVAWVLLSSASAGQAKVHVSPVMTATIEGRVTDVQGHPVAKAVVELKPGLGEGPASTQTDFEGRYRFTALASGSYSLDAKMRGYQVSNFGPFQLAQGDKKRIDLKLQPEKSASALGTPEFFDQPQFTIAGVTDTTNLGGHASGMAGPSNSLAKDVGSLSGKPSVPADDVLEQAARQKADRAPNDFEANYRVGKMLLDHNQSRDALPYLERVARLQPSDFEDQYALARAYSDSAEYDQARVLIQKLQATRDTGALHHLLADIEEKSGKPLEAVQQYQRAAELDPSEANLFDWGVELLTHRAVDPAIAVFSDGYRKFPQSVRLATALGIALYERGSYEEAMRAMCEASDVSPRDPRPYLFLGRMQNAEGQANARLSRLERFAQLDADNPWANYYLALALWKGRRGSDDSAISERVETLLNKAIRLDPKMAEAHLQLGILRAEAKDQVAAIEDYKVAIELNPALEQAHYRLAQAYMATGERDLSSQEIEKYRQISKSNANDAERERKDMRQFVYTMKAQSSGGKPD